MKALTIWQPWAWAIVSGGKDVENRTWRPPNCLLGKTIAIHAAKRTPSEWDEAYVEAWASAEPPSTYVLGAIIGTSRVIGALLPDGRGGKTVVDCPEWHRAFTSRWWMRDQYAWVLTDRVALPEPIPFRGAQGLWDVPEEIVRELMGG